MRQKKIRGHNRRLKQIENWRLNNLSLNLIDCLLNHNGRYYEKISIHPWNGLSLTKSVIPQPTGKTKLKMLSGLLDIYHNWKTQLDKLEQPYYLKIWLFEPRFSLSQVVCAIGDDINRYDNTFYKPVVNKNIYLNSYGSLSAKLSQLNWDYSLDEDHYFSSEICDPDIYASRKEYEKAKTLFKKILLKPHRIHKFKDTIGDNTESYSFARGIVWLGG